MIDKNIQLYRSGRIKRLPDKINEDNILKIKEKLSNPHTGIYDVMRDYEFHSYTSFAQQFVKYERLSPKDFRMNEMKKIVFRYDELKRFLLKNLDDPLLIYLEINVDKFFCFLTRDNNYFNDLEQITNNFSYTFGISKNKISLNTTNYSGKLYEVIDKKFFSENCEMILNSHLKSNVEIKKFKMKRNNVRFFAIKDKSINIVKEFLEEML